MSWHSDIGLAPWRTAGLRDNASAVDASYGNDSSAHSRKGVQTGRWEQDTGRRLALLDDWAWSVVLHVN